MAPRSLRLFRNARLALFLMGAILLLAACGPNSVNGGIRRAAPATPSSAAAGQSCASAQPSSTPTVPPSVPPLAHSFNSAACVDMNGLHIQTAGIDCDAWVVLAGQQTRYDTGTIQQMSAYLDAFTDTYYGVNFAANAGLQGYLPVLFTPQLAQSLPRLPAALQVVAGTRNIQVLGGRVCRGLFDITNVGSSDVQLLSVGATHTSASTPNATNYRLVNTCTLPVQPTFCGSGIGGGAVCRFIAEISLQGGSAGTKSDAPVMGSPADGGCDGPLTISPGGLREVQVEFASTEALLYNVQLALTLNTSTGSMLVQLPPAFNTSLAFARDTQFSCYDLKGTSFVIHQGVAGTYGCV